MSMYILWILYALFLGSYFRTCTDKERNVMGKGLKINKEDFSYYLYVGGLKISLTMLAGSFILFLVIAFINDMTYAVWIGSILGFLSFLFIVLIASIFIEVSIYRAQGEKVYSSSTTSNYGSSDKSVMNSLLSPTNPAIFILLPFIFIFFVIISVITGSILPIACMFIVIPIMVFFFAMLQANSDDIKGYDDSMEAFKDMIGLGRDNIPISRLLKTFSVVVIFLLLIISNITPYTGNVDFNPTFNALNETDDNTADSEAFLTDYTDVRVISWDLATQYLQRAYSDAASTLSTDQIVLSLNTDPDYVEGKFVWVNAPQYETLKWMGGKEMPFFVYVVNDLENMSKEGFDAVYRSNESFDVHREKVTWENRINQVLHDRYAGSLVTIQIRINLDDHLQPFWVVYLGKRHILYDVVDLEKILIIDAKDIENIQEYDIDDPNIPEWLEVVYPDNYLMDWAKLWGSWRDGILYKWFNKRHLSFPDDTPRFLILNGTSYWYLPMRQLDSQVLAGYILMNTRTGETVYHNREERSLADQYTARLQVDTYLSSGIQGFRLLKIQEGYLYPINTDNGRVREAYIFPLYSGFTIQQYAIVDAEYYTQNPFFGTDLQSLLQEYRSHKFEADVNVTYTWSSMELQSAYADDEEGAFTANGTTYVVDMNDLMGGALAEGENEWREYRLAVSDFDRGDNVTLDVVISANKIVDVDYQNATLVQRQA